MPILSFWVDAVCPLPFLSFSPWHHWLHRGIESSLSGKEDGRAYRTGGNVKARSSGVHCGDGLEGSWRGNGLSPLALSTSMPIWQFWDSLGKPVSMSTCRSAGCLIIHTAEYAMSTLQASHDKWVLWNQRQKGQVMPPEKLQLAESPRASATQEAQLQQGCWPQSPLSSTSTFAMHPGQVRFSGFSFIIHKMDIAVR